MAAAAGPSSCCWGPPPIPACCCPWPIFGPAHAPGAGAGGAAAAGGARPAAGRPCWQRPASACCCPAACARCRDWGCAPRSRPPGARAARWRRLAPARPGSGLAVPVRVAGGAGRSAAQPGRPGGPAAGRRPEEAAGAPARSMGLGRCLRRGGIAAPGGLAGGGQRRRAAAWRSWPGAAGRASGAGAGGGGGPRAPWHPARRRSAQPGRIPAQPRWFRR